jgi:hypothetical protein
MILFARRRKEQEGAKMLRLVEGPAYLHSWGFDHSRIRRAATPQEQRLRAFLLFAPSREPIQRTAA